MCLRNHLSRLVNCLDELFFSVSRFLAFISCVNLNFFGAGFRAEVGASVFCLLLASALPFSSMVGCNRPRKLSILVGHCLKSQ